MKWSDWYGCYDSSLRGLITSESFAHPAKMAKSLTERIFDHGQAAGYWAPGSLIVDPFGGIGTTGLIGAYRGYNCLSVELESHFVALAHANIDKNARKLLSIGRPIPVHVQGDSRNLREYVAAIAGAVTSPPYADALGHGGTPSEEDHARGLAHLTGNTTYSNAIEKQYDSYRKSGGGAGFEAFKRTQQKHSGHYSDAPAGAVTSPPYADSLQATSDAKAESIKRAQEKYDGATYEMTPGAKGMGGDYGATPGQLGAMNVPDYWTAVAQVYAELYAILPSGGAAAIVVKDYIKKGKRVDLCHQTAAVLEATGFTVVERCKVWLIHERTTATLFGEDHTKRVERKSFFRRLAEKNGSPHIDWEEVIWAVK